MGRRKNKEAEADNQPLQEADLTAMNREQLTELALTYEIAFTAETPNEEIIKAILEAEAEGDKPDEGGDANAPVESGDKPTETPQGTEARTDPAAPPKNQKQTQPPKEDVVTVICKKRKGETITAVTGKPIVFDADGSAKASKADAEYLKNCPGFEVK